MKKAIITLIILLLFFDSCGYIFVYLELSNYFKNEGIRKISEYLTNDNLEIIVVHKSDIDKIDSPIEFVKKHEIKYKDELFDICKEVSINDSIYYYCINDKNENLLEKAFSTYVENKTQDNSKNTPINNILRNIIKVAIAPTDFNNIFYPYYIKFISHFICFFPKYSIDTPTPPPKFYS